MKNTTTGKKTKNEQQHKSPLFPVSKDSLKWQAHCPLKPITSADQNGVALNVMVLLAELSNAGKLSEDERDYYRVLRMLVRDYESKVVKPIKKPTPGEMLEFFMEQNDLKQIDLIPQLGSQTTVSYILSNKRLPTLEQSHDLAKRFGVDPAIFIGDPRKIKKRGIDRRKKNLA